MPACGHALLLGRRSGIHFSVGLWGCARLRLHSTRVRARMHTHPHAPLAQTLSGRLQAPLAPERQVPQLCSLELPHATLYSAAAVGSINICD